MEVAVEYLKNEVLRDRLIEITMEATYQITTMARDPVELFGSFDAPKFHECATLFLLAAKEEGILNAARVFEDALNAIAEGKYNATVLKVLQIEED